MKNDVKQPEGNYYDKYNSSNFIVKIMMKYFFQSIECMLNFIESENLSNILEAGCGEGEVTNFVSNFYRKRNQKLKIDAFDVSNKIIEEASKKYSSDSITFRVGDIYNINYEKKYDLVICSEVLEHLEEPDKALKELCEATTKYIMVSVPREPLWRILNMCRGKYIHELGNTPGHIQHWSKKKFLTYLKNNGLKIVRVSSPLPWTMVLLSK